MVQTQNNIALYHAKYTPRTTKTHTVTNRRTFCGNSIWWSLCFALLESWPCVSNVPSGNSSTHGTTHFFQSLGCSSVNPRQQHTRPSIMQRPQLDGSAVVGCTTRAFSCFSQVRWVCFVIIHAVLLSCLHSLALAPPHPSSSPPSLPPIRTRVLPLL